MNLSNVDAGIHRAIKAQFVAKGVSAESADAKASQVLPDACKLFHEKCKEPKYGRKMDDVAAITHGMRAVVAWARTL